jgi:hypothetical protein
MIDLKRAIKQGGGDYILWLSVTCAPIDVEKYILRDKGFKDKTSIIFEIYL